LIAVSKDRIFSYFGEMKSGILVLILLIFAQITAEFKASKNSYYFKKLKIKKSRQVDIQKFLGTI